jgi:methionyl-tRNA synthetase
MSKDTFYITTPIYYASSPPHIGSAYTTLIADIIARWHRLHGRRVHFLTGLDEHGARQVTAAREAGMSPQQFVDDVAPRYTELWSLLGISNDDFIRTTEDRHKAPVGPFMEKLKAAGDIYVAPYEGWYCERCEEFKSDDEVVDGRCPIHQRPVERLREDNYYFRLSKYNDALIQLYEEDPEFLQPRRAYNEMYSLLKQGLLDQAISRPTVTWGIPVPWDQAHVIYVWIEALANYITAIGYETDRERFERIWPADVHLMAKEIVRHHAVVWPAMLMSVGLPLPKRIFAHGWLLAGGEKISKSGRGISDISPVELVDTYGVDGYRFHFARGIRFGGDDANFSLEDLHVRYNAELANDLGNLVSRTLNMIERYCGGVVPSAGTTEDPERSLLATIEAADPEADGLIADLNVTDAVARVWEIVRHANRYLVEREPWKLAKDEANAALVGGVLNTTARALVTVAALLSPVMPLAMHDLWSRLGYDGDPALDAAPPDGNRIRVGEALFPRLES